MAGPSRRKPKPLPKSKKATSKRMEALRPPKVETNILGPVHRHLIKEQTRPNGRDQTVIHPSEAVKPDWCPRQDYYRISKTSTSDEDTSSVSAVMEVIFEEGHQIHEKWQTWLWQMGELQGIFECIACGAKHWMVAPKECDNCGAWAFRDYDYGPVWFLRYREVPLFSKRYLLGGHADGLTVTDPVLLEVKSMGPGTYQFSAPEIYERHKDEPDAFAKMWRDTRRPLGVHVRQAMLYSLMLQESNYPKTDKVTFIYEAKPNQANKEFTVEFFPELIEDILDQCLDVAYAIKTDKPPRRPRWATGPEGSKCRECPYRTTCWSEEASTRQDRADAQDRDPEPSRGDGAGGVRPPRRRRRPRPS